LQLVVGLETQVPSQSLVRILPGIGAILLLAWLAIAALVLAWARSIRSRELATELEAERRERARLGEMSLAAAGLAHETKNPLGLILGLAQRLQGDTGESDAARDTAEQIMDAADRATARLSDFINFARLSSPKVDEVAAAEVLGRVGSALRPDFDEAGVKLELAAGDLKIRCDPGMLEQILVNLLLNSLQASPAGTTTSVRLERHGQLANLTVADQGRGIAPHLLPELFKPYVSDRPDGHGLGLAIVKRIAEQHGWAIAVKSEPGRGAAFTLSGIRVAGVERNR
jgi:two-component system, NtrC family, sensor histidine kinase HydH